MALKFVLTKFVNCLGLCINGQFSSYTVSGWCHVVCALYIPEACFANVQTMEPIVLNAVPHERFNKVAFSV